MINNNKILTVSYGTFSCTLEGFDDSFGTMKAIAEYFRDLASDDRYFGAEPPQPDAEMLQRIAEREISRRVEARHHEGKIYLSAEPEGSVVIEDADKAAQAEAEAQARAEAEAKTMAQAKAEAVQAEADRIEAERLDAERVEAEHFEAERVEAERAEAERLEAERAEAAAHEAEAEMARVQAEADARAAAEAAQIEEDAEQSDDVDLSVLMAHAEATDAELSPRDLAAELPEAEAFFAGSESTHASDDLIEDSADDADNSIAAKLDRIRAVVSQADSVADDDDGYTEDEHAEDVAPALDEAETATADALADIEAALAADDETQEQVAEGFTNESHDDSDDVASILAALDDDADEDESTQSEAPADVNLFDDSQDAGAELPVLELVAEDKVAPEALAEEEPKAAPRRLARVVKVKRADLEAAIAQGDLEEISDVNSEADTDVQEGFTSSLSDDDEADLARELAEVVGEDTAQTPEAAPHALPALEADDGDDLSRLMAEADQQMGEEEGAQRRDAFAHLRAAVAAKKADTGLGETDPEQEKVAYRDDLATAVKPRRPSADRKRTERPDMTQRPAPLKLVAEQRVDGEAATETRGPVRPRRIAAVQEAAPTSDDASSFIDFAVDMGANSLSDLLEAAASYLSFVEGREQFTRPQLMNKVRQVEKDDFSREDGLRSFGQLLRAGKIEKLQGGRFAATGEIGFHPDARAAG